MVASGCFWLPRWIDGLLLFSAAAGRLVSTSSATTICLRAASAALQNTLALCWPGIAARQRPMLQDRNTYNSNKTFWRAATRRSLAPQCEPATLNKNDELGMTPLMWASMYTSEPAVIELLIERSANVRAVTKQGVTALHWAAHYNKSARAAEIVQALLLGGADPTTKAQNGLTAAEFALDNGNSAVAAVLAKLPRQ